ncbi:MAG: ATP-binding cassette domain-containing protein [Defluviitaleaceae bacterium]|nr:ATP-binding cassette domain-containing protein [Defluviitaleaceae bacterium]MCL2276009.1 ATP-binding cassette domain-containing protein [Defluviitaleaceae bacterium]
MENIISVSHLQKAFKKHRILKDVSFNVTRGSIFALLGSNGAGKTTTVRILSTLLKPDGGASTICGYDVVRNAKDVRKCISLTGQFAAVDEVLTGAENLHLIAELKRLPNIKAKVLETLSRFRLQDAASRAASTYSGGMRRRLDIAMSLLGDPQVIFLDEPTTGLDPQNRISMWEMVKELAAQGTTVFLTTQYLEEAEALADTIAILHEGRIIAEGTPDVLKAKMPQRGAKIPFKREADAKRALQILQEHGFETDEIEMNLPSLEDVFLTLIGEKPHTEVQK